MSQSPLISVLMPAYNAERYVAQAVASILTQTLGDFEFLIVNDGSSDRTPTILERYARQDSRIRLISRPNTGHIVALNEMLHLARGEYIARMDADDIALPQRFELQVEFLQHHSAVVCVGGAHEIIDEAGRLITCWHLLLDDADIQKAALAGHGSICHPCAMIRREALLAVGGYNSDLMPAEDLDLWLRLGELGKLANLPQPVLRYRIHSQSVSEQQCDLQRQQARKACEQAWQRRGIEQGIFEAGDRWRPGRDRWSRHHFMVQYGWWAFGSGQQRTALIYGVKAIKHQPFAIAGWKLLVVAALKPLPAPL
jgi:glycosyltransferase involved in cell wall biosynthesis